ncbi:MAG TPA: folylpolyglutamate synthase/dihydrofolate synthase family protein [Syntrophales bacterium]|nr:folylpolyglutamate synthase/dihydrofolate synthase family protein [Syntrophales bacterium]
MNDQETLTYLTGLLSNGMRLDLAPFEQLLAKLKRPHKAYATIMVGGTNGKGSIASMITSILMKAGFHVGLYTSPHLVDVRERIQVNGDMISPAELNRCVAAIKTVEEPGGTYFECLTAAAFLHFQEKRVDLAVLEVGMGGRLDATNVADPLVSVICNVTLEHTDYLGKHLREIAGEKAGIIKSKGVCLTGATQPIVRQTLRDRSRDLDATLLELGKDFKVRRGADGTFSYQGMHGAIRSLKTALTGDHQVKNAALAIAAVEVLVDHGYAVEEEHIVSGLAAVRWPGRLEVVRRNPTVILDGAHNPAAGNVLVDSLKRYYAWRRFILVFGVLLDKDYPEMIKRLCPLADRVILTLPDTERAAPPDRLFPIAARYCRDVAIILSPRQAIRKAVSEAAVDDLICVCGSLYLVGEVKGILPRGSFSS